MPKEFTHIDKDKPHMVDVGDKIETKRTAIAKSEVQLPVSLQEFVADGEIKTLKGPVFQTAIIAGIQGAKRTAELIPLCHNLPLSKVSIDIQLKQNLLVEILCEAHTYGKTGVEMEALTGASVAALTIYDMCKAFSHEIEIKNTRLIKKTGGKSDFNSAN
ncbi:MAG: cyclic pyranopterin monophosphate synthase MoaC [Cytophagales bacterium CG12_big_fil_rev_8_21_14_0_65_40_12]|nr:MAG: cyclic pyranopterin monophosphate synthase MoaC [Cytophagales bacterium CG12_big_fil_rev_8_21_14_0_65_40_12]PIW03278.1 MAG: cyclic pyranopterin monophosphate synthase MoaC [Cytophagales bacterium CG17_big_fil_post_rev_8_21_14_2_50_40_13]